MIDCVWCALFPGRCDVLLGIFLLLVTSESANVEGARVLTTIEVPRAVSGQVGSGSGGAQRFKLSMCTYTMCASESIWIPQLPIPWVRALSYMVLSMANITCSSWLEGSTEVSSIQWGKRAPLPCCHSCASDDESLFIAARAPRRMIRIGPPAPMKRMCLDLLVVGLRAALCGPDSRGDYTHPRRQACMV